MSLSWIPKGVLDKLRKVSFRFLWGGTGDRKVIPWVRWERLAYQKY